MLMKGKYVDDKRNSLYKSLLKKCMNIKKTSKDTSYFFYPRITEEWKEGGVLVVGINHWCPHNSGDCKFYKECMEEKHNCRKFNKNCVWAYSEVGDEERYDLRYNTYEAFDCYFEHLLGYSLFKEFLLFISGTQDCMETEEQKRFWNRMAFYNYIQHYTKKSLTHTSSYGVATELEKHEDEDFEAFKQVLSDLKPRLVIVWHKDIKDLLLRRQDELGKNKSLKLVDDLGIPTRSMFRFVYCDDTRKSIGKEKIEEKVEAFKKTYKNICEEEDKLSVEQILLRLIRWRMFHTETDLRLLTEINASSMEQMVDMLNYVEENKLTWNEDILTFLVGKIQEKMVSKEILEDIPFRLGGFKKSERSFYSNIMMECVNTKPLVGVYPEDCSHYSLSRFEEKDILSLAGLQFDGIKSKPVINNTCVADGFVIYIDDFSHYSKAFFTHLFKCRFSNDGYSLIIMKFTAENDKRCLDMLNGTDHLHTIKNINIGDDTFTYILLQNKGKRKVVNIGETDYKIANLKTLKPNSKAKDAPDNYKVIPPNSLSPSIWNKISSGKKWVKNVIEYIQKGVTEIKDGNGTPLIQVVNWKKDYKLRYNEECSIPKMCYRYFVYKIYKLANQKEKYIAEFFDYEDNIKQEHTPNNEGIKRQIDAIFGE